MPEHIPAEDDHWHIDGNLAKGMAQGINSSYCQYLKALNFKDGVTDSFSQFFDKYEYIDNASMTRRSI